MTQTVLLGDLLTDLAMGPFGSNLKVDSFVDSGVPIIKGGNLYDYEVSGDFSFVSEGKAQSLKRSLAYPDDIVITHRGTLGQVSIVPDGKYPYYLASQSQLRMTPNKDKINPRYLLYYLRSSIGQHELMQHTSQVGVPSIATPTKAVKSFKILLPELDAQKKIANILGAIDEKIKLNRKINETLEQTGQALFRHYFIDNPESEKWEKKPLGDFVELVNGASYKSAELAPSTNALVTLKSVGRGGGFSRRGYKEFVGKMKNSQIVHDGDLVVAHTDLTQKAEVAGYPALVDGANQYDQVAISMDLVKVTPHSQELGSSLVYFLLKTREFQEYKMGYISGSTVLHLNKKCIPSYEIALPSSKDILSELSSEFDNLMKIIKDNNQQIQTLTTLRDVLLPRLISGKVHLRD